ncbi:hypothetical protein [Tissierella sp.]|uniref:hypothetical protein n=1 Tax=Tissierella sp. TaxID=41274 RepID=UPI0028A7820F|nr:hypothetical protein [Tissierella sp.]
MKVANNMNFKAVEKQIKAAIGVYADTAARKMEGHAKEKAPWEDRTSNARNSIQGDFGWKGDQAIITLSGNVDYFVYLELAMAKKHAILIPTIHQVSIEILQGYQRLVR